MVSDPPFECPQEFGYFPNPYECKKYYQCSSWISYVMECPEHLIWDTNITGCQEPDVAKCDPIPYPE